MRALKVLANDPEESIRIAAIKALGSTRSTSATYTLLELCRERNLTVRRAAVEAIGTLGDGAAVPVLVELLRADGDPGTSEAAILALGDLRADAVQAVPLLVEFIRGSVRRQERSTLVDAAAGTLARIGEPALPGILSVVHDPKSAAFARERAVVVIHRMAMIDRLGLLTFGSPLSDQGVTLSMDGLIKMMREGDSDLRVRAADALGEFRYRGRGAASELKGIIQSAAGSWRVIIARTLFKICPDDSSTVTVFSREV
jgi:hypothetical protein